MPVSISAVAMSEKNKRVSDSVWLIALEMEVPGLSESVRIVTGTDDITWRECTWVAFPFEFDEITETSKSEVPKIDLRISNVGRVMETYLDQYNQFLKSNERAPIIVNLYLINSKNLAQPTPEIEHTFQLKKPRTNAQWCTLSLSADNPYKRRFPQNRILSDVCRYKIFKEPRCGYVGPATTCNRSLARCRELGNSNRFGGFLGSGASGLQITG